MTKKQKIDFINKTNDRFLSASNHGHNGRNWWYPKQNTIAYDVKIYGGSVSMDEIRKEMTKRQNEYYNKDDFFYDKIQEIIQDTANDFSNELDTKDGIISSGYAGRSCGWLEVEYRNNLTELDDFNVVDTDLINEQYNIAVELDKLETETGQEIEKAKSSLKKYLSNKQVVRDIIDNLLDDKGIGDEYKGRAKRLLEKLN